jgi:hypothetical protein
MVFALVPNTISNLSATYRLAQSRNSQIRLNSGIQDIGKQEQTAQEKKASQETT